ncbi:hypothetical protein [Streptomyces sp. SID4982]|uniref:hypothetical protein n=2 Tax=unclassified Streptomyces TaxID=2593676 RepID=UPI00136BA766|nr:hypothetical protein [Streptomyces sp. SID4982]MYS13663.1 hypothetical protein [Streptomyces sp. SID4982]
MTDEDMGGRSTARAHLSQLIDMFGSDGCLRISTTSASDTGSATPTIVADRGEPEIGGAT